MANDIVFADGITVKKISDTLFDLGINAEKFTKFVNEHESQGWLHINLSKAKEKDSWYAKLNTWKPDKSKGKQAETTVDDEEIPY